MRGLQHPNIIKLFDSFETKTEVSLSKESVSPRSAAIEIAILFPSHFNVVTAVPGMFMTDCDCNRVCGGPVVSGPGG